MSINSKFDVRQYETLIHIKDKASVLLSELLLCGPLSSGNPIVIQYDRSWVFAIDRRKKEAMKRVGRDLFGNSAKYNAYIKEYSGFMSYVYDKIIPAYGEQIDNLTVKEFLHLIKDLKEFWRLYGYLEFVFHDFDEKAGISKDDNTLESLGSFKLEARKLWNLLSVNGTLNYLLTNINERYFGGSNTAEYLPITELYDVINGGSIDKAVIDNRRKYYAVVARGGTCRLLSDEQARDIAEAYKKNEMEEINKASKNLRGAVANKGVAKGMVVVAPVLNLGAARKVAKRMRSGDILVVQSTDPNMVSLCQKAGAIIADQGGMLSHAAIISRELGIPCIVGTKLATKVLKDGDYVEVDATNGIVRKV